jgi:imidazolonepropionase-like amidohydrolase
MDTELVRAIREEADRRGTYVAVHHTVKAGLTRCLAAGVRTLEHMTTDAALTDEEIRQVLDGGQILVPTGSVAFALAYEKHGDPNWGKGFSLRIVEERAREMPRLIQEFSEPELAPGTLKFFHRLCEPDSFDAWHLLPWPDPAVMNAAANFGSLNTRVLYEAGANFGCGNDGGVPLIFPGAMGLEMVLLQEQGIKPADVFKMATVNNARLLRLDGELGTVEKGKIADLVVFEKNPLEDLYTTLAPRQVFQAGRLVFSA